MITVILNDTEGTQVASLEFEPEQTQPEIVRWGNRLFVMEQGFDPAAPVYVEARELYVDPAA